jgi:hypothetical protein
VAVKLRKPVKKPLADLFHRTIRSTTCATCETDCIRLTWRCSIDWCIFRHYQAKPHHLNSSITLFRSYSTIKFLSATPKHVGGAKHTSFDRFRRALSIGIWFTMTSIVSSTLRSLQIHLCNTNIWDIIGWFTQWFVPMWTYASIDRSHRALSIDMWFIMNGLVFRELEC